MKIVSIEPLGITEEALNHLSSELVSSGNEFIAYSTREEDQIKLIERVHDADIVIVANQPFSGNVIEKCTKLKFICIAFTGVDHVDIAQCRKQGIAVSNAAGYSTNAVAELTYGLIIDVYRYILPCDEAIRKEGTKGSMIGFELNSKKLGIIGTGAIGMKVAEIGKAFGCEVIAYSRTKKIDAEDKGIKYMELEEVLKESDIISLHLPLNDSTRGIISKEKLEIMKSTAILINTARGPIVDNNALAEALKIGRLGGAGIDVFETEPPIKSNHPLMGCPNTVLTPHVAFATKEALYKRAVIAFDNVKYWINGRQQNII